MWWESHRLFCGHYHISHLQFHILQHATLLAAWLFLYTCLSVFLQHNMHVSVSVRVCVCAFMCVYQTVRILTHHLFRYRFLLICKKAAAVAAACRRCRILFLPSRVLALTTEGPFLVIKLPLSISLLLPMLFFSSVCQFVKVEYSVCLP